MLRNLMQTFYTQRVAILPFVSVLIGRGVCCFKGPLGTLFLSVPLGIGFTKFGKFLIISSVDCPKALFFTFISLVQQKMRGVLVGFFELLHITGTGWRVLISKQNLIFKLGFSHDVVCPIPSFLEVLVLEKQVLKVFGLDLELVSCFVSTLCTLRSLDVYKGKGIRSFYKPLVLKISSKSK